MNTQQEKASVIVTGGSTGIGETICRHLLDDGYHVIALSRRHAAISHERLVSVEVDLSDMEATRQAAEDICARHSVLNLVHNAGVIRPALLADVDLADLDYLTHLHLGAVIILAQAALPKMKKAGYGRIVNIASRAALGLQTRTSYSATKSGMIGLTRTWALELAPFGITVNAVSPGPIVTDMFHDLIPEDSPKKRELAESIPVKRLGTPDDVARAVTFFLDPASDFINGQNLFVCGGTSVGSLAL